MEINKEGNLTKLNGDMAKISCPFCNCDFKFSENDLEIIIEKIPYQNGIKGMLKITKDYIVHKYITCPWCKNKLKLKYVVDDIEGLEINLWND